MCDNVSRKKKGRSKDFSFSKTKGDHFMDTDKKLKIKKIKKKQTLLILKLKKND